MTASYSEEDGAYHYEDGVKTIIKSYCVKDPSSEKDTIETIESINGKGIFWINEDGNLVWINDEEVAADILFEHVNIGI